MVIIKTINMSILPRVMDISPTLSGAVMTWKLVEASGIRAQKEQGLCHAANAGLLTEHGLYWGSIWTR
jgi:hypothetical protein